MAQFDSDSDRDGHDPNLDRADGTPEAHDPNPGYARGDDPGDRVRQWAVPGPGPEDQDTPQLRPAGRHHLPGSLLGVAAQR